MKLKRYDVLSYITLITVIFSFLCTFTQCLASNGCYWEGMNKTEFKKENGSYICKELLGCDLSTKDGIDFALEKNLFTEFCPKMVESATKIAENILNS